MKDFVKYIFKNKGKLFFLSFVTLFAITVIAILFSDETTSNLLRIGATLFVSLIGFLGYLHVWREYKGYEGLFGRK